MSKRKRKIEREVAQQERRNKDIERKESEKTRVQLMDINEDGTDEDCISKEVTKEKEKEQSETLKGGRLGDIQPAKKIFTTEEVCMSADRHGQHNFDIISMQEIEICTIVEQPS